MTLPDGGQGLDPEALEHADFRLVMRGFDRVDVKRLLAAGGAEIRRLRARLDVLASQVAKPVSLDELTEEQLIARLGDDAVAVLHAAQETANQILTKSKENAEKIVSEAQAEAGQLRSSAETERATVIMNAKSEVSGAESTAAKLKHHAVHEADREIDAARVRADKILEEAKDDRESAATEVASMHAEAKNELRLLLSARNEMLEAFATAGGTLRRAVEQLDGPEGDIDLIQSSLDVLLSDSNDIDGMVTVPEADSSQAPDTLALEDLVDAGEEVDAETADPEQLRSDVTEFVVEPPDELEQVRIVEGLDEHFDADVEPEDEVLEAPPGTHFTGVRILDEAPEGYMPSPRLSESESEPEFELLSEVVESESEPEFELLSEVVEPEPESEPEFELLSEVVESESEPEFELLSEVVEPEPESEFELLSEVVEPEPESEFLAEPEVEDENDQDNSEQLRLSDQPSAEVLDLIPRERPDGFQRELGPIAEVVDIRERGERELVEAIDPAELLGPVTVSEGGPLDPLPGEYIEGPDTDPQDAEVRTEDESADGVDSIGGLFDRIRDGNTGEAQSATDDVPPEPSPTEDEHDEVADAELEASERQLHDPIQARDEYLLMRRDNAAKECAEALSQRLKRVLMDEQNALLDLLRRWSLQGDSVDVEEMVPLMGSAIQRSALPGLKRALSAGAGILDASLDREVNEIDGAVALSDDLVAPLKDRLERSLLDGIEGAEGRVRAIFREWRAERLGPAVETAVLGALGRGLLEAIDDNTMVRWVCPIDHKCADGAENELVGVVAKGAVFPSGHLLAPAYSGCRCLVVPTDS